MSRLLNSTSEIISTISERVARQSIQRRLSNYTTTVPPSTTTTTSTPPPFLVLDERETYWGIADRDVPILIGAAAGKLQLNFHRI